MNVIIVLFFFFQIIILIHLFFPLLLLALKPKFIKEDIPKKDIRNHVDYAIIVTAYEQTSQLTSVVNSILLLNYDHYLIYVVADKCDISNLNFNDDRVILLRPEKILSSNIKSHFYAINNFKRSHDRLTIIDSDNLVEPNYLIEMNLVFDEGFCAVQGAREPKNLNSIYAALDAGGDLYYRYLDRKLLFDGRSSASLAGSGMAFTVSLYIECLECYLMSTGAGFDKILQYEIVKRKLRIAFAERAIVYDEKTAKSEQLIKQRARWINTWFKFFKLGVKMSVMGLRNLNLNQLLFSVMLLRPPLFLIIFFSVISFLINVFLFPLFSLIWIFAGVSFISVFFVSLSYFNADKRIYDSLRSVPKFMFFQFLALFKAKRANELSVATQHENDISLSESGSSKKRRNETKN